jgi:hypothetical protein
VTSSNTLKTKGNVYDWKNMFHVTRFCFSCNFFFIHCLVAGIYPVNACHYVSRNLALYLWLKRTAKAAVMDVLRAETAERNDLSRQKKGC